MQYDYPVDLQGLQLRQLHLVVLTEKHFEFSTVLFAFVGLARLYDVGRLEHYVREER